MKFQAIEKKLEASSVDAQSHLMNAREVALWASFE